MALASCVKAILCGLGTGTRAALVTLVTSYRAQLEAQKAALEAKLVYLNIISYPPQLLQSLAEQTLTQLRAGASIIPLDLIGQCADINQLTLSIQQNIDVALSDVNIVLNDLTRLLSYKDDVEAIIEDLNNVISVYTEILGLIEVCGDT